MRGGRNVTSGGQSTILGAVPGLPAQRRMTKLGGGGKMRTGRKDSAMTPFARAIHKGKGLTGK